MQHDCKRFNGKLQQPNLLLFGSHQVLYIELTKGSGGLGFTLAGGANTVGGCFVRDIVGGPAKEDGRLQAGDQILAVRNKKYCVPSVLKTFSQ